jgi:FkbM family methyltransferase
MQPASMRAAKWAILGLIVLFIAVDAAVILRKPAAFLLYAAGRAGFCDASSAMGAWDYALLRRAAIERNRGAVRKLREDGGLALWDTLHGPFWTPVRDGLGFVPLLAEQEIRVYGKIHPGDVVIDAGANIGDFTRAALENGASLVVAIEIAPDTIEALRRNLAREIEAGQVIVETRGVWNTDAEMDLLASNVLGSGLDSVVFGGPDRHGQSRVRLTTLDRIVEDLRLNRVDFVKLDVEGAEVPAVVGARNVLRRFRPRLALDSENFTAADVRALQGHLSAADPRYRMLPGPCILLKGRIRADVIRFEVR